MSTHAWLLQGRSSVRAGWGAADCCWDRFVCAGTMFEMHGEGGGVGAVLTTACSSGDMPGSEAVAVRGMPRAAVTAAAVTAGALMALRCRSYLWLIGLAGVDLYRGRACAATLGRACSRPSRVGVNRTDSELLWHISLTPLVPFARTGETDRRKRRGIGDGRRLPCRSSRAGEHGEERQIGGNGLRAGEQERESVPVCSASATRG